MDVITTFGIVVIIVLSAICGAMITIIINAMLFSDDDDLFECDEEFQDLENLKNMNEKTNDALNEIRECLDAENKSIAKMDDELEDLKKKIVDMLNKDIDTFMNNKE